MVLNQFTVTISVDAKKMTDKELDPLCTEISEALDDINFTALIRQKFKEHKIDMDSVTINVE